MSNTKRNDKTSSEGLRYRTPYKRQKRSQILRTFELEYIENNRTSTIEL